MTIGDKITLTYDRHFDILSLHRELILIMIERRNLFLRDQPDYIDDDYYHYVIMGSEIEDYCLEVKEHLEYIRSLGPSIRKISYTQSYLPTRQDLVRFRVVEDFIKISATYVEIESNPKFFDLEAPYCINCGELRSPDCESDETYWMCKCGYPTYRSHVKNDNITHESDYNPELTFIKECNFYQGKEDLPLPLPEMFDRLDAHFQILGINRQKILSLPADEFGKKPGTSLILLNEALKHCGYSTYYKRANYIGQEYWGWVLIDLEPYMSEILNIYQRARVAYSKIIKRRKSSLSLQNTLRRILEIIGIRIREEDFKLCITDESKQECEILWEETCHLAGLPYIRHF